MSNFKCYYCDIKEPELQDIIDHCIANHDHEVLKYRQLVLDETSGHKRYQTKTHEGVIPAELKNCGKSVTVHDGLTYIFENESKRKKLNTPMKDNFRKNLFHQDAQSSDDDYEVTEQEEPTNDIDIEIAEMVSTLPAVLKSLESAGHKEKFKQFLDLLASGTFPKTNICYLLFLDIIEWFSCESTTQMRYGKETLKFWQIGYRLFHGKFLRFMSGPRSYGQVLDGTSEKGVFDPLHSKVNFAVPSRNNLYKENDVKSSFFPGINVEAIKAIAPYYKQKPLKLSVDGKKISRGKCKNIGDIDCWGHEKSPTLSEKKEKHETDIENVDAAINKADAMERKGYDDITHLDKTDVDELSTIVKNIIVVLGLKNRDLRESLLYLESVEAKFKKLGEPDWKTSRFYPVICSVRISRNEIKNQITESLRLTEDLAYVGATMIGQQSAFVKANAIDLKKQHNVYQLNPAYDTDESQFIRQRTEQWFDIRKEAKVTGSTCNAAAGLARLKDQQSHIDKILGKSDSSRDEFDDETRKRMEFGATHEIDAVATLAAKVLPFLYPNLKYFEEGCMRVPTESQQSFMVVSPDGTLRESPEAEPSLMYENKCKSPNSYNPSAYYSIPHYYALQLLSEMNAYRCQELLFTCWSPKSMTVFHVRNDTALWMKCFEELRRLFDCENITKPTRFSDSAKEMKEQVKDFVTNNATFIGEFPSCTAFNKDADDNINDNCYVKHTDVDHDPQVETVSISQIQDILVQVKTWLKITFDLLRSTASEILVFMLNDLDRIYNMETNNAHPIAYALKGPSMSTEVFGKMMENVINECERNGLNILVTASDGQWHLYGIRDNDGQPLTIHQLHKDHWKNIKTKTKPQLRSAIMSSLGIDCLTKLEVEKQDGNLILRNSETKESVYVKKDWEKNRKDATEEDPNNETDHPSNTVGFPENLEGEQEDDFIDEVDSVFTEVFSQVDHDKKNMQSTSTFCEMEQDNLFNHHSNGDGSWSFPLYHCEIGGDLGNPVIEELSNDFSHMNYQDESNYNQVIEDQYDLANECTSTFLSGAYDVLYGTNQDMDSFDINTTYTFAEETMHNSQESYYNYGTSMESRAENPLESTRMERNLFMDMDVGFESNDSTQHEDQPSNQQNEDETIFEQMLKALVKNKKAMEIHKWTDLNPTTFSSLFSTEETIKKSFQRCELLVCCEAIESVLLERQIKWNNKTQKYKLVDILLKLSENYSLPENTNCIAPKIQKQAKKKSEIENWSKLELSIVAAELEWKAVLNKWKSDSNLNNTIRIKENEREIDWFTRPVTNLDGKTRFHFTDACHILTCLRTKVCTTGISGLRRKAWEEAALSTQTKLNVSVVVDCVDKQDVALARRMFASDVESVMESHGYSSEAEFCKLVRNWFDAEDEPAIPADTRCQYRLDFREWLLQTYPFGLFPPATRYVRGVPIVSYEALILHTERKIQLYDHVPGNSYNVRATGSQEVEQFFSTFRDLDPTGKGTPKPDVIPEMMATVVEIDNFRLNPDK